MASQALMTLNAAREFLTDRSSLRVGEHRRVARAEYVFDVLAREEPFRSEVERS
jgi:hypothetical protein